MKRLFDKGRPFVLPVWLSKQGDRTLLGSATVIDQHHVVTCSHVILTKDGDLISEKFLSVGESASPVEIVAVDRQRDLALLRLVTPLHVMDIRFVEGAVPNVGAKVEAWAWLRDGPQKCSGQVDQKHSSDADDSLGLMVTSGVLKGFSGGPGLVSYWSWWRKQWGCAGIVRLGGEGAARTRLVGVGALASFLSPHGTNVRVVRVRRSEVYFAKAALTMVLVVAVVLGVLALRPGASPDPDREACSWLDTQDHDPRLISGIKNGLKARNPTSHLKSLLDVRNEDFWTEESNACTKR
jgi:hypothetical protein